MDIEDYERDRAEKKLLMKLQEAEEAVKGIRCRCNPGWNTCRTECRSRKEFQLSDPAGNECG